MTERMNVGARLSESSPWAMVLPPGSSCLARSWSTWIHCSSQVASANLLMRSWVISIHSLAPTSVPAAALISSNPLNIRMVTYSGWLSRRVSDFHFRNLVRNGELGFRDSHHLRDADARRRLQQRDSAGVAADYRHLRHDQIHRPLPWQRQSALLDDLPLALWTLLHSSDDALRPR